jgi:hypothetical protein
VLLGILGATLALGLLLLVIWVARRSTGDTGPLKELSLDWSLNPVWDGDPPERPRPAQGKSVRNLSIYLDVSEPMGGFLPPPANPDEPSGFRSLVNQLPDQLVSVAGGTGSSVQWFHVASGVSGPHERPSVLRRGTFSGGETRLDSALRQIRTKLDQGENEMSVLVTDLIATEDLVGAMGAAKELSDWMHSSSVRTGDLGIGLLGVRASYWGVYGKCGAGQDRGCWFSEQAQRYRPMSRSAQRPFYILVLGRGLDNVDRLGHALLDGAREQKLDAHWELLSQNSRPRTVTSSCQAWKMEESGAKAEQFALLRKPDGSFECRRGERVSLICSFPPGNPPGTARASSSWPSVQAGLGQDQVVLKIDCAALRSKAPVQDLVVTIDGELQDGWAATWKSWSAATDDREEDLGRTLRLESFIEKVWLRPDHIHMSSGPILKGRSK